MVKITRRITREGHIAMTAYPYDGYVGKISFRTKKGKMVNRGYYVQMARGTRNMGSETFNNKRVAEKYLKGWLSAKATFYEQKRVSVRKYVNPKFSIYSRASKRAEWTLQDKVSSRRDALHIIKSLKKQKPSWEIKTVMTSEGYK